MDENVCRLCLQTIPSNNNCQAVDESLLKSLKLNLKISKENVMCIECASCLRAFSNFTPGCAFTEEKTLPLSDLVNGAKLDPETASNSRSLMGAKIKCSFCTKTREREDLISLQISNENKILVNMLEQHISEMNLKDTEEFLTCDACLEALEGVFSLILKCVEVEERISKYIELEGTDDKDQIELKKVQQFMHRPILKLESESLSMNNKIEEEYTTMAETEIKDEKEIRNTELIIKSEDDIATERSDYCDIADTKSEQSDCDGFQEPFIENKTANDPLHISTKKKSKDPIKQHLLAHKSPSEKKMFKCELCSYETKRKTHLKRHSLTHRNHSEINMFKCELCSYETTQESYLKRHSFIHKSPSEINMFKCPMCPYEGKHKIYLTQHLLAHKSPSELKMFHCEFCSYLTKRKKQLTDHLLIHKSPSKVKMFKCDICSYETKRKSDLRGHLSTHNKKPSETFKCDSCSYQGKYKYRLEIHLLTHKNSSEIKVFKCELCSYEAKWKSHLKTHLLTHKNPSDIKMFKCLICSYETKRKPALKCHLLTHKSPSEIKTFKCALCSYESKWKWRLRKHLLTHRR